MNSHWLDCKAFVIQLITKDCSHLFTSLLHTERHLLNYHNVTIHVVLCTIYDQFQIVRLQYFNRNSARSKSLFSSDIDSSSYMQLTNVCIICNNFVCCTEYSLIPCASGLFFQSILDKLVHTYLRENYFLRHLEWRPYTFIISILRYRQESWDHTS